MARFLNINPTYNPFTMDELLKIPLLYDAAYKEADKNITEYKDKMSRYKALAGDDPRAQELFVNYDNMLTSLQNDYSIRNMNTVGKELRNTYRDITAKFDKAEQDYNIYREMKLKNPNLVGDIGNIMDYYGKSHNPKLIDGKEFATLLGADIAALAQQMPYKELGYVDRAHSQIMYGQGFTNEQLSVGLQEAMSGNPTSQLGKVIYNRLNEIGYNNLPTSAKLDMSKWINTGLLPGIMKTQVMKNANFRISGRGGGGGRSKNSEKNGYVYITDDNGQQLRIKTNNSGTIQFVDTYDSEKGEWKPNTKGYTKDGMTYTPVPNSSIYKIKNAKSADQIYKDVYYNNKMKIYNYDQDFAIGFDKLADDEYDTTKFKSPLYAEDSFHKQLNKLKNYKIINKDNYNDLSRRQKKAFDSMEEVFNPKGNKNMVYFSNPNENDDYYALDLGDYKGDFSELNKFEQKDEDE